MVASSPGSLAPRMKEGGSDAVPGTLPAPSSGPSQPAQIHRDPSPVLSLLLGASVTCIGPTRTFQNQWRGGALGLWSTHLLWVKLNPASASPTLQKGKQRPWIRTTLFLHSLGALLLLHSRPGLSLSIVGAGGPPCTPQGREKRHKAAWPVGFGWGSLGPPSHCHLPSCYHLPW